MILPGWAGLRGHNALSRELAGVAMWAQYCQIHLQLFKESHLDLMQKLPFFNGGNEFK